MIVDKVVSKRVIRLLLVIGLYQSVGSLTEFIVRKGIRWANSHLVASNSRLPFSKFFLSDSILPVLVFGVNIHFPLDRFQEGIDISFFVPAGFAVAWLKPIDNTNARARFFISRLSFPSRHR